LNPGFLKTELQRHLSGIQGAIIGMLLKDPINGAYCELFAGMSPEVTIEKTGSWSRYKSIVPLHLLTWYSLVIPFGRFGALKKDIELSGKRKSEGGNGRAEEFWEWSEKQVQQYL